MVFTPGMEQLDPALLAFIKCHVTSPLKWEVLRVLADLVLDGVVEIVPAAAADEVSYRLASDEPTSVVLHRLIDAATHSQQLRGIIAAHLQHVRQQTRAISSTAAA